MDMAGRMIRRGILGGTSGSYKMELGFQSPSASATPTALAAGHLVAAQPALEERHNENTNVYPCLEPSIKYCTAIHLPQLPKCRARVFPAC